MRIHRVLTVLAGVFLLAGLPVTHGCSSDGETAAVQPDPTPPEPPAPEPPPPPPPEQLTIARLTVGDRCRLTEPMHAGIRESDYDHLVYFELTNGDSRDVVLHRGGRWIVFASGNSQPVCPKRSADLLTPLGSWDERWEVEFPEGETTEFVIDFLHTPT